MTDLNTAIADFKGWKFEPPLIRNQYNTGCWRQFDDNRKQIGFQNGDDAPDFEHDARLYMALADDMPVEMSLVNFEDETTGQKFWQCSVVDLVHQSVTICEKSDTIGTVICLAYCKLKGIEVAG